MLRSALIVAVLALAAGLAAGQSPDLPPGPVQEKARTACLECHDAGIILQQRLDQKTWTKEVDKMIRWGATVDAKDRDAFIDYLSTNFPADKPPVKGSPYASSRPKPPRKR